MAPPNSEDLTKVTGRDVTETAVSPSSFESACGSGEFEGNSRFVLEKRLGAGTFGIVYRALDRERNSAVALKVLRTFRSDQLLQFKHEFRSLVDVVHPNLVQLYELFADGPHWFFTMELVEGADFLSYLRPGNLLTSWDRLRDAFRQLADGVEALHASGRLHRDLKPSNVLVTRSGRVLILDFGLVKVLEADSEQSTTFAGSPAYMAPEQAAGGTIKPSADWYAVGVMLYRAITGEYPFHGPDLLARKRTEQAPAVADLVPEAPADLNEICRLLLSIEPERRIQGTILLREMQPSAGPAVRDEQDHFVGRDNELALMNGKFAALSSGEIQVVLAHGRSGIGKTSLLMRFLAGLRRECPSAVILKGRCHESESVPYKALDSVMDALVRYLQSLPDQVANALLPRHPELLKRLFPVFGELAIMPLFAEPPLADLDEQETRSRAFAALLEMLGRMTDRGRVVIAIDDLQWADLDSIAFLEKLILSPNPPALLLVLAFRSEDLENSPPLCLLHDLQEQLRDPECWTEIELKGLSDREGRELLNKLQYGHTGMSEDRMTVVVEESAGSPLLLRELLRFVSSQPQPAEQHNHATRLKISEVMRRRIAALSPAAQQVMECLAVAGEPLSKTTLRSAIDASGEVSSREIWLLTHEKLVRLTGGSGAGKLELFHDQAREAVLSWLSPASRRHWHERLARAIGSEENADSRRLVRHYRGAGDLAAAFEAAVVAARMSEEALAFDRAARFYAEAFETGNGDPATLAVLHRKRAEALAKAGRGRESGACYLEAAKWTPHNDPIDMRRLASEQLMRAGYLDEGTRIYHQLLAEIGVSLPEKPLACLIHALALRAFARWRGFRWRERPVTAIPPETLRKLDLLWNGALVLTTVSPIVARDLHARHFLESLRAGDPFRLALSAGLGAVYESLGGESEYHKGRKLLDFAESLSRKFNDAYLTAVTQAFSISLDFMCGRIQSGVETSQKAAARLTQIAGSVAWETVTCNAVLIWFLGWGGRIRQLAETAAPLLEDARSRGDVYAEVTIRCFTTGHLINLAEDHPDRAIEEIARARSQWRKSSYDFQHFGATLATVECELYSRRAEVARQLVLEEWKRIRRSLILRKAQPLRIALFYMRGRTALAIWLKHRNDQQLQREVEHYSKKLVNTRSAWGEAMGKMLRAGLLAGMGRSSEALLLLEQAESALREQDLRLLAAAVSRRRGELEGNAGVDRIARADEFMRSENIVRPDRMTAMILPGNWLQG